MSRAAWKWAALAAVIGMPAQAVNTPFYDVPYVALSSSALNPDSNRRVDVVGGGYQLLFAWPLASGNKALELRLSDYEMRRDVDDGPNYQTNLTLDYVHDFGAGPSTGGFLSGSKPFVFAGGGLFQEDSFGRKDNYLGVEIGAGVLLPLGFKGWALRLDGRVQAQSNKDYCNSAGVAAGQCKQEAGRLVDFALAAGVQVPLSWFFKKPIAPAPVPECELAVVDPDAPRGNCRLDQDRDGVPDDQDRCPGTERSATVDADGCAAAQRRSDRDLDGVPDDLDRCHTPLRPVRVDADGCAVAQNIDLPADGFMGNTSQLSESGRAFLDRLARVLAVQQGLDLAVAPYAEAGASPTIALVLAEQRGKSVRDYLAGTGIAAARMTAVPATSTPGDAGRVELRIVD